MKKLDTVIKKSVFEYNLIEREDNKAIYSQSYEGEIIAYEVFKVKVAKEIELFGTIVPEHEKFPGDNDFGVTAWSCKTYEKALERYHNILVPLK